MNERKIERKEESGRATVARSRLRKREGEGARERERRSLRCTRAQQVPTPPTVLPASALENRGPSRSMGARASTKGRPDEKGGRKQNTHRLLRSSRAWKCATSSGGSGERQNKPFLPPSTHLLRRTVRRAPVT